MDLTVLASDRGPVPMNIAAVLDFEPAHGPTGRDVAMLLAGRLPAVPRLRQRLQTTPPGGGRPIWIDDAEFDLDHHLVVRNCPTLEENVRCWPRSSARPNPGLTLSEPPQPFR